MFNRHKKLEARVTALEKAVLPKIFIFELDFFVRVRYDRKNVLPKIFIFEPTEPLRLSDLRQALQQALDRQKRQADQSSS